MSDDFALDFIHNLSRGNSGDTDSFGARAGTQKSFVPGALSPELKKYLSLLNPEQKAAVEHSGSPLLILAGAGSGKTRVITTKIAYLINQKGYEPYQILAVTFTKKAAKEMQDRAVAMEERSRDAVIRTFHSFGAWFLRKFYQEAGVDPNFTVYDDDDMASLVKDSVPSLTKQQAIALAHKISLAKDYCYTPDTLDLDKISSSQEFRSVYRAYEDLLRKTGNVDFGDLIMLPVKVLEKNENVRRQMHYRFKVIMVDEYQDSNVAQYKLLKALAGDITGPDATYVCVVGDDDQSIYKFRGAEVQNILSFQDEFEGTTLIRLERNYRSTDKILFAADKIVSKNEDRLGKTLIAERGNGKKPVLVFLPNQDEEARFAASMIKKSHEQGCPYSDWAILYRTNAQSFSFEGEFTRQKIPYVLVGSLKFFAREEVKDVLSYLDFIVNPKNIPAFKRIVNKPSRGIGESTQNKIIELAKREYKNNIIEACSNYSSSSKKTKEGLIFFNRVIEEMRLLINNDGKHKTQLSEFINLVIDKSGFENYYTEIDDSQDKQKLSNLNELVNTAVSFEYSFKGLLEYLDSIQLERTLSSDSNEDVDSVTLITLHNTKGLEFSRVIITGLETGIFPRQEKTGSDLEEERRLFYVGITRAKDELYITSCATRRLYGRVDYMEPSVFLIEAGDKAFRVLGEKPSSYEYQVGGASRKDYDADGDYNEDGEYDERSEGQSGRGKKRGKWSSGTRIFHDDYGYGQIVKSRYEDGELVIDVQFENARRGDLKRFLPEYQKNNLTIVKD